MSTRDGGGGDDLSRWNEQGGEYPAHAASDREEGRGFG